MSSSTDPGKRQLLAEAQRYVAWHEAAIAPLTADERARMEVRLATGLDPRTPAGPGTPLERVDWIVVHHSETRSGNVELFRWLHRLYFGWEDIGYHYVVGNGADGLSTAGDVAPGRPESVQGAHVRGHNGNSLGVCLVGNYDVEEPSGPGYHALVELVRSLLRRYQLTPERVRGHREFPGVTKTCPGTCFSMDALRRRLD